MRKARFLDPAGSIRTGEWTEESIITTGQTYDLDEVELLPPVEPGKVLGIGRNYRSRFDSPDEFPNPPRIWYKGGPNVVSAHESTVPIPASGAVAYEVELGVVIGEQCRHVTVQDALQYVEGYTCVNDLSDKSHPNDNKMLRTKSFDNAAPMGPAVVSPDLVPDNPRVELWVNGVKKQDSVGDRFIKSVPEVVSIFSKYVTLEPDDVIMMGNPGDHDPLKDGDHIEIKVEGVGRLEHDIAVQPGSC